MTRRFGVAVFSIAAHIALGTLVIVMSLLSADALPTPRRVLAFEFHDRLVNLPRDIDLPAARPSPSERVLRSIPLLDEAALDAIRQWRFDPASLNRQPVPVAMTVTVNFALER